MLQILEAVDWNNWVTCVFLCGPPTVFSVLVWRKSPRVGSKLRILAAIAAITVFGWVVTVLNVFCGEAPDNGFAYVCALLFWLIDASSENMIHYSSTNKSKGCHANY